jgi:hypothetical protein
MVMRVASVRQVADCALLHPAVRDVEVQATYA